MQTLVTAIVIVVVVALVAGAVFWWTRRRVTPPPPRAGEQSRLPVDPRRLGPPPERQVLDRNTVLGHSRTFDPTNWDDTPDGFEEDGADLPDDGPVGGPAGEDLPRFFDRDYLERKRRGETPDA